jgi:hypothetical protein
VPFSGTKIQATIYVEVNLAMFWLPYGGVKGLQMVTTPIFIEWPHLERLEAVVDL